MALMADTEYTISQIKELHQRHKSQTINIQLPDAHLLTNVLGFMNVILLHRDHRHVSATHVTFFRLIWKRIQI